MNLKTAYQIFDLSETATQEETKKKYKELAKKYHPDINKEEDADGKFKSINEAYQCIINEKGTDKEDFSNHNPFHEEFHNPFGTRQVNFQVENISLHTTLSFKESVLGCQRDLHFSRNKKCTNCNGKGISQISNGCEKCGGKGQIVGKQGNMIFSRTCDKCMGNNSFVPCNICSSKGYVNAQVSINVNIPGGVVSGNILRLGGFGNYIGGWIGGDQYTEAHLHLTIDSEEGMSLENNDVVSFIDISLLEALCGTQKIVKTVLGERNILIPALFKNKDEVKIPNLGVNGIGSHRVIVNVEYPSDINSLINLLNTSETSERTSSSEEVS